MNFATTFFSEPASIGVPHIVMLVTAAIAAVTDHRSGRIPNWLTYSALLLSLGLALLPGSSIPRALLGILGGGLVPYLLFRWRAMGGGDVKLFAALGGLSGLSLALELQFLSFLVASLFAIVAMTLRGDLRRLSSNVVALLGNTFRPAHKKFAWVPGELVKMRLGLSIFIGTCLALGLASWT